VDPSSTDNKAPLGAHWILDELFDILEIDPGECTYAKTVSLCAFASPSVRDERHADVLIRIQPIDPQGEDIAGWAVRVKEIRPAISAEIEEGGRLHLIGLPQPNRYRLQAYKPASMLPTAIKSSLATQLLAATELWKNRAPSTRMAASRAGSRTVLKWPGANSVLSLDVGVNSAGDATLWFRSDDLRLDGVPILIQAGAIERWSILARTGPRIEGKAILTFDECSQAADDVEFRLA